MTSKTANKFSPEVCERAVRMFFECREEHPTEWAVMVSIATKIGCVGETLRSWVRQAERDSNARAGPATEEKARVKGLEREVRELR